MWCWPVSAFMFPLPPRVPAEGSGAGFSRRWRWTGAAGSRLRESRLSLLLCTRLQPVAHQARIRVLRHVRPQPDPRQEDVHPQAGVIVWKAFSLPSPGVWIELEAKSWEAFRIDEQSRVDSPELLFAQQGERFCFKEKAGQIHTLGGAQAL